MGRRSVRAQKGVGQGQGQGRLAVVLGGLFLSLLVGLGVFGFLRRPSPMVVAIGPDRPSGLSNSPRVTVPPPRVPAEGGSTQGASPALVPGPTVSVTPTAPPAGSRPDPVGPTGAAPSGASNRPVLPSASLVPAAPASPAATAAPVVSPELLSTIPDRPPTNILEAQIVLACLGISPGSVDGVGGYQTMQALRAFQNSKGLEETGRLDSDTQEQLRIARPLYRRVVLKPEDFEGLAPVPDTWLGKSKAQQLGFETLLESLAERSQASPVLLRRLNPGVDWSALRAGQELIVPNTIHPPARRAALARISLEHRHLRVFDANGNLLAHFPCSIGRIAERRPVGELEVASVVRNPNYTFNPSVFPESEEARTLGRRLVLPAGPNNPVGVAWIGLSRAGYGIHGTPVPEMVGRTESHGCFRLANWNADYLRRMSWVGMPIWVEL